MLTWKRAVDRWNLMDEDGEIVGAVTHEVLARCPALFEQEQERRGWPDIPPPAPRPEVEWTPLTPAQVWAILEGRNPC